MKKPRLKLEIKHLTEDRELVLYGDTMNELVEKIIEWQTLDNSTKEYYDKKGKLREEIESGWYYNKK
jgi:hypothetical protein